MCAAQNEWSFQNKKEMNGTDSYCGGSNWYSEPILSLNEDRTPQPIRIWALNPIDCLISPELECSDHALSSQFAVRIRKPTGAVFSIAIGFANPLLTYAAVDPSAFGRTHGFYGLIKDVFSSYRIVAEGDASLMGRDCADERVICSGQCVIGVLITRTSTSSVHVSYYVDDTLLVPTVATDNSDFARGIIRYTAPTPDPDYPDIKRVYYPCIEFASNGTCHLQLVPEWKPPAPVPLAPPSAASNPVTTKPIAKRPTITYAAQRCVGH